MYPVDEQKDEINDDGNDFFQSWRTHVDEHIDSYMHLNLVSGCSTEEYAPNEAAGCNFF